MKVEGGETEEIKKEDIEKAIRKLKKKSASVDGVRNKAWKYANSLNLVETFRVKFVN